MNQSQCNSSKIRRRQVAENKFVSAELIKATLKPRRITVLAVYRDKPRTTIFSSCDICGFEWTTTWNQLQRPKKSLGCPKCAPNARVTIEDYQKLAKLHGGKLLKMASTTTQPSQWKCAKKNHPSFWRPYNTIKKYTFCPECSNSLSERICRNAAEQLFGFPFTKTPLPIRGVGGRNLIFDAYNESLKLAIEHNGAQHYHPVRFGRQTKVEAVNCFHKQQEHDRRRRDYCRNNDITLIEVPELGNRIKIEDLKEFIRNECKKANYKLPDGFNRVILKLDANSLETTAEEMWKRILNRVQELGYTLKTADYPGANGRLMLFCNNGHEYKPRVANFLKYKCKRCLIEQRAISLAALPLGKKTGVDDYANARIFDTIEDCAKTLETSSNNVRTVIKGRGNSCVGFGVAQITKEQAKIFRKDLKCLVEFCRLKWPSPQTYDKQDSARKALSQPVKFFDGRKFPSKAAAAKFLGVSKAAIYYAVRKGGCCKGYFIQLCKN